MAALRIEFRPAAVAELQEAIEWYRIRNPKVADRLCRQIEQKLAEVAKSPNHWPLRRDCTRHILVPRFPYLLIVREVGDAIEVVAVAHTSRRPGYWRKRDN
jgi:toxin ParE1/3/4